jgi:hypothetical protein
MEQELHDKAGGLLRRNTGTWKFDSLDILVSPCLHGMDVTSSADGIALISECRYGMHVVPFGDIALDVASGQDLEYHKSSRN